MRCNKLWNTGTLEYTSPHTSYQLTSHTSYHYIIMSHPYINSNTHILNKSIPQLLVSTTLMALHQLYQYEGYCGNLQIILSLKPSYSNANSRINSLIHNVITTTIPHHYYIYLPVQSYHVVSYAFLFWTV